MSATEFVLEDLATLATPRGTTSRLGEDLDRVHEVEDPALAVRGGRLVWVGPRAELPDEFSTWPRQSGGGGTAVPGFVDPHTHAVFAGHRADEFERRARGADYLEILAAGGGILDSMRRTRAASEDELFEATRARLEVLLQNGTTTVEVKSGYGLDTASETKMLRVARRLGDETPLSVVPTFLGAHAVPPEYKDRGDAYVDLVIEEMLPAVVDEGLAEWVDVFCETGVFDLAQTRRVLEAGAARGLKARIHADEVHPMGGGRLAAEMGARSADHLIATTSDSIEAMAEAGCTATILPGTAFVLGKGRWAPAREMIEEGCPLALATDLNPGSCHLSSMPMAMQIAVVQMGLTPGEALTAGTLNAAASLDLGEDRGSLEVGKRADVAVLDAPSYRHLAYRMGENLVRQVYAGGERVVGA